MSEIQEKTKTAGALVLAIAALGILIVLGSRDLLDIRENANQVPLLDQRVTQVEVQLTDALRENALTNKELNKNQKETALQLSGLRSDVSRLSALIQSDRENR